MQAKTTHIFSVKNILALALLVLIANWFFTIGLVCLKDDNSFYYMPVRMYLSDALHTQGIPYWNPYLMNGVPQHADMQGAVWNPIAFTLAYFFHYNHTTFLVEYMLYVFIAAMGIYKLMSVLTKDKAVLIIAVVIYTCCGFVSGISNFINWTASLGCIPWMVYFFYKLLQQPNFKNAIWLAFICWLMIVCGYPAFFIYAAYCLLAVLLWQFWYWVKEKNSKKIITCIKYLFIAAIVSILLCLPAMVSYIEFLPYYSRGHDLATDVAFRDCFYPQFLISLLVPASVYNKIFDPFCHSANRDIYFGIIPFLLVLNFIIDFKKYSTSLVKLFTGIAIFTFIFLFGFLTPLGNLTFKFLPLMGAFKWSAAARIFLIILFISAIAIQLKQATFFSLADRKIKILRIAIVAMLIGVAIVFFQLNHLSNFETSIHQKIFQLNTVVQASLLISVFIFLKKIWNNKKWMLGFIVIDLLINYSIGMAITGVGNVKPSVFNTYATSFYQQNPDNYLDTPLAVNRKYYMFDPWKNHNASKILNGATFLESNTVFSSYEQMFILDTANERLLRNNKFVFSTDVKQLLFDTIHLAYNNIDIIVNCSNAGNIILQQNNYHRWKEKSGLTIATYRNCFISLPVKQGKNEIHLYYDKGIYPTLIKISMASLLLVLLLLLFGCFYKILPTQWQPRKPFL